MAIDRDTHGVIKLACGHGWPGQTQRKAEIEEFARISAAMGDTALCPECGQQSKITEVVEWRKEA